MSVFKIDGELDVQSEMDHQEVIQKLFKILKENGIHFKGETKQVIEEVLQPVNT
ncbi:hypothetical protein [Bacillus sp. UMB0728]|uniref:hypothetical protein n=1 Tax=Bacillus sp. UMB0728 TaxID=2066052 RepID=UPI0015DD745D|nr:hypothetical protein [Bacillus sp. UMB0728]